MRRLLVAKSKAKPVFTGLWHIVSMETWDEDYFNEEVQAFIEFEANGPTISSSATFRGAWTGE